VGIDFVERQRKRSREHAISKVESTMTVDERISTVIARAQAYKSASILEAEDRLLRQLAVVYTSIPSSELRTAFALRVIRQLRDLQLRDLETGELPR
jgi:hypothetical protein